MWYFGTDGCIFNKTIMMIKNMQFMWYFVTDGCIFNKTIMMKKNMQFMWYLVTDRCIFNKTISIFLCQFDPSERKALFKMCEATLQTLEVRAIPGEANLSFSLKELRSLTLDQGIHLTSLGRSFLLTIWMCSTIVSRLLVFPWKMIIWICNLTMT